MDFPCLFCAKGIIKYTGSNDIILQAKRICRIIIILLDVFFVLFKGAAFQEFSVAREIKKKYVQ